MRYLASVLALYVAAISSAFAAGGPPLPEPETLALFGIGAVALLLNRSKK